MHCSEEGRQSISNLVPDIQTLLSHMVCAQYRAYTWCSCWEAAIKAPTLSKNLLSPYISQGGSFPNFSSFHWSIPVLLPSTFRLPSSIYFSSSALRTCGSWCSLEQVELCRLQIKHYVYLHFFRRFTISFYTKSQVKSPNLMVCIITRAK